MKLKIATISIGFILCILLLALASWFETEEHRVEAINRQHLSEIKRLQKISKINAWLNKVVKPSLDVLPNDANSSDDSLVKFYDTYANVFHFSLEKYIYKDANTHNLKIDFQVLRSQRYTLNKLMTLKYKKGFLQFNSFKIKKTKVEGELLVVQPYYGENNASYK